MPRHCLLHESISNTNNLCMYYHLTLEGFRALVRYQVGGKSAQQAYIEAYESHPAPLPAVVSPPSQPNPVRKLVEDCYTTAHMLAVKLRLCPDSKRAYFNALLRREGFNPPDPAICETMASASSLARHYGMTPKSFGSLVARLRNREHGEYRLTHLATGQQVPMFFWNQTGQEAIKRLLNPPVADMPYLQLSK